MKNLSKKHKILSYSVLSSYYYHIDNIDQALINIKEAYQLVNEYYKMNDKENIEISLDYIKYLISVEQYQEAEILLKKHFPYIQSTSPLYSLYISAFIALYKHLGDYHQIRHYLHLLKESIDHLDQSINKEIAIISYAKQLVSIREYKEAKEEMERLSRLPFCPVCGKKEAVERISTMNRTASVLIFGLASSKIGKQYVCRRCNHKF